MKHLFLAFLLIAGCVFDRTTAQTTTILDDVPGCTCLADEVCDASNTSAPDVRACEFTESRRPTVSDSEYPYKFESVNDELVPICDALEADAEFQETVGNQSRTYDIYFGDKTLRNYYKTGPIAHRITYGICDDLYAEQNSCPGAGETPYLSQGTYYPEPRQSAMMSWPMPVTKTLFRFTQTCKSSLDDNNITMGHEDGLLLYVTLESATGDDDDDGMSIDDVMSNFQPVLTSEDWIEPIAGSQRRYMSHSFVDVDGRDYCLLVVSLGNEPCKGPPPLPDPSSASTNILHAGVFHMGYFVAIGLSLMY